MESGRGVAHEQQAYGTPSYYGHVVSYKITSVRLEYFTDLVPLFCANTAKYNMTASMSQVKHKTISQ